MTKASHLVAVFAVGAAATLGVGCSDAAPAAESLDASDFAKRGGCNQVAFWAVNADSTTALWVSFDIGERRDFEDTLSLPLSEASSFVELRRGVGLDQALCGDAIAQPYQVDRAATPVSGSLALRVGSPPAGEHCGAPGVLGLRDVVFDDGTTIASLDIETAAIGCFVG